MTLTVQTRVKKKFYAACYLMQTFSTRNIAVSEYNSKVIYLNRKLKEAASELPRLRYWKHKGLKHCAVYPYWNDGVHLNAFGMQRYMRSVRGAVLYCCRHNSELRVSINALILVAG